MTYIASYYTDKLFSKDFNSIKKLKKYNEENNIKNHNLYLECKIDEILKNGHIVCLEGDDELEEKELSTSLKKYGKKYLLLNNLYKKPQQLNQLKNIDVDILIIQSTGIRKEEIKELQNMYINKIGNFPKNIICILGGEEEFLYPLIEAAPFKIKVYSYKEVDNNNIIISKWLGTKYQEEN